MAVKILKSIGCFISIIFIWGWLGAMSMIISQADSYCDNYTKNMIHSGIVSACIFLILYIGITCDIWKTNKVNKQ